MELGDSLRSWVKVVTPAQYTSYLKRKRSQIQAAQKFIQKKTQQRATVGGVKLP